jgi:hypothetical protein
MPRSLEDQIAKARLEISADTISMSVSELTNLYREGVLEIRPEFQRLFRWDDGQKSRLVESILLGIPLPSLFVAQSEVGIWELVDGLQRVSTILELQGLLKDPDGDVKPALRLSGTKFLSSLDGYSWSPTHGGFELSEAHKLDIRLARLDLRVIKRGSDPQAKFDLFQRLNSFGSALTSQEIRSAMVAGTNSECLAWLTRMAGSEAFSYCTGLADRLIDEQYDIELVLRFLMLHDWDIGAGRSRLGDFSARLDDWSISLAAEEGRWPELENVFQVTFGALATHGAESLFRKWDSQRERFVGGFSNTAYEVIAMGLGNHVARGDGWRADIETAAKTLWELPATKNRFATGLATQDRFVVTLPLGRKLMADPPELIPLAVGGQLK